MVTRMDALFLVDRHAREQKLTTEHGRTVNHFRVPGDCLLHHFNSDASSWPPLGRRLWFGANRQSFIIR